MVRIVHGAHTRVIFCCFCVWYRATGDSESSLIKKGSKLTYMHINCMFLYDHVTVGIVFCVHTMCPAFSPPNKLIDCIRPWFNQFTRCCAVCIPSSHPAASSRSSAFTPTHSRFLNLRGLPPNRLDLSLTPDTAADNPSAPSLNVPTRTPSSGFHEVSLGGVGGDCLSGSSSLSDCSKVCFCACRFIDGGSVFINQCSSYRYSCPRFYCGRGV